jgi:hypothetical protein
MLGNTTRLRLLVLLAAAACCNLFAPSAAACDKNKLASLMKGAQHSQVVRNTAPAIPSNVLAATGLSKPASMVGLWSVTDFVDGQPFAAYFDTWNSDGNEFFIDNGNPADDNVCQGTWVQTSINSYKLKHVSFTFDDSGNQNGTAIFHDVVTISADGNSYTGTEDVYIYDLGGNLIAQYIGDQLQATRIKVDF